LHHNITIAFLLFTQNLSVPAVTAAVSAKAVDSPRSAAEVAVFLVAVELSRTGAFRVDLLLQDGLRAHNLGQALEARRLQPARRVRLESGDDAGLGDLVRARVLHVDGLQEQDVGFGVGDARGDGLHDLAVDGLLVVGDEVLVEQLLDLVGGEPGKVVLVLDYFIIVKGRVVRYLHPADILDDLNVIQGRLLQLQQLGGLHKMLQLQRAFGHVVALAPFLNACDVVVDL
jgi:hypothetical protein